MGAWEVMEDTRKHVKQKVRAKAVIDAKSLIRKTVRKYRF